MLSWIVRLFLLVAGIRGGLGRGEKTPRNLALCRWPWR
jgi:hypothetical protein